MGIFKPQHLVPHGADLFLAIPPACLDGGEVVYTFPGAEKDVYKRQAAGQDLEPGQRDALRAKMVRERLAA